jgi:hypothetical protein
LTRGRRKDKESRCYIVGSEDGGKGYEPRQTRRSRKLKKARRLVLAKSPQRACSPADTMV